MLLFAPASCEMKFQLPGGEEEIRRLSGGQLCFVGPGFQHTLEWQREAGFAVIYLAPSFLQRAFEKRALKGLHIQELAAVTCRDHIASLIISIFRSLCEDHEERDREFIIVIARSLAARLIPLLCETLRGGEGRNDLLSRSQRRIVIDYMDSCLGRRIPTAELAKLVGFSSAHFMRTFKNTTGAAAGQFHLVRRLHQAEEILLRKEASIADVANQFGFFDQNHFTRHFRKHLKYSPSALLALCKKPPRNGHF